MGHYSINARRAAFTGVFTAVALIISLFEYLLPPIVPVLPYARAGISNIIILGAIFLIGVKEAYLIIIIKSVLTAVFMGNPQMILYSLPSGLISLTLMCLLIKTSKFSLTAISMSGGAVHNLVQLGVAAAITQSFAVFVYTPYLTGFGAVAGVATGIAGYMLIKKFPDKLKVNNDKEEI
ncbi:MAG: Gx transporter family protein [Christensenellales bacterium]|jgi:heptaprenyl diphosphate synthase